MITSLSSQLVLYAHLKTSFQTGLSGTDFRYIPAVLPTGILIRYVNTESLLEVDLHHGKSESNGCCLVLLAECFHCTHLVPVTDLEDLFS